MKGKQMKNSDKDGDRYTEIEEIIMIIIIK